MVSSQVHTLYCQLRHWNYCPALLGVTHILWVKLCLRAVSQALGRSQRADKCQQGCGQTQALPTCTCSCTCLLSAVQTLGTPRALLWFASKLGCSSGKAPFTVPHTGKTHQKPWVMRGGEDSSCLSLCAVLAGLCPGSLSALPAGTSLPTLSYPPVNLL